MQFPKYNCLLTCQRQLLICHFNMLQEDESPWHHFTGWLITAEKKEKEKTNAECCTEFKMKAPKFEKKKHPGYKPDVTRNRAFIICIRRHSVWENVIRLKLF